MLKKTERKERMADIISDLVRLKIIYCGDDEYSNLDVDIDKIINKISELRMEI